MSIIGSPIAVPIGANILSISVLTTLMVGGVGIHGAYRATSLNKALYNYVGKHILNNEELLIKLKNHAQKASKAINELKTDYPDKDLTCLQ